MLHHRARLQPGVKKPDIGQERHVLRLADDPHQQRIARPGQGQGDGLKPGGGDLGGKRQVGGRLARIAGHIIVKKAKGATDRHHDP